MITFRNVRKQFGGQIVLDDVSFQINPGERVGLVGRNGAGKSTVFGLIVGDTTPDRGDVQAPPPERMGYVRQHLDARDVSEPLLDHIEHSIAEPRRIRREIAAIEEALHSGSDEGRRENLRRLGELQSRFEHLDGYGVRNRAERALVGLGFPAEWFSRPFRELSGGWQTRADLARILVADPAVLLLDEPSNYLDLPAVEWLRSFLDGFRGTLALISHDRYLLNALTTATLEISCGRVERYAGNYDAYAAESAGRREQRTAAAKNQQRKREQVERFIERFRAQSNKAAQVQSRVKQLARIETIVVPKVEPAAGRIRLRPPPHCGAEALRLEGAGFTYDGERWILRGVDLTVNRGEKLAVVGYNGMGKTTLLRLLAGRATPSEGRRVLGHRVLPGYQSQDFADTMDPFRNVFETLKNAAPDATEQELRTLLGGFGFSGVAVEKPVSVLSGGEKIRLAFARLLVRPPNLLILDEPTTHLDVQAREALEQALCDYTGTLCFVSHDAQFVRRIANGVLAMTPPGVTRYVGGYDYYLEKQAAEGAGAAGADSGPAAARPMAAGGGAPAATAVDRKALRRERAQARQERQAQTRDSKREVERCERQIAVYEAEQNAIAVQMAAPAAGLDFAALSRRLAWIRAEIAAYTARWESAALRLDALEKDDRPPP